MLRLTGLWIGIYPIVAHSGVWLSYPRLAVGYLAVLVLFLLLYPRGFLQLKNIVIASMLLIAVVCLAIFKLDYMLVYLPPVVIPAALMMVFIQSLGENRTPLITQFALKMEDGELAAGQREYTRRVTQLWAGVFAFMVAEGIVLAIWAPIEVWSWVTHIGNYILIACILASEFIYRNYRFELSHSNFMQFILALFKHQWK